MATVNVNIEEVHSVIRAVIATQTSLHDASATLSGQAGTVADAIGGDSAGEFQSRFKAWVSDIDRVHDHLSLVTKGLNDIIELANKEITTIKGLVN